MPKLTWILVALWILSNSPTSQYGKSMLNDGNDNGGYPTTVFLFSGKDHFEILMDLFEIVNPNEA